MIDGESNWDFCCLWYHPESIRYHIARQRELLLQDGETKIPEDIYSEEFANWLTHEYRLAMNKGMELMERKLMKPRPDHISTAPDEVAE